MCSSDLTQTAPTVFDLNGDGIPEVLLHGYNYFNIFNGKTGALLYQDYTGMAYTSGTQSVVIADIEIGRASCRERV